MRLYSDGYRNLLEPCNYASIAIHLVILAAVYMDLNPRLAQMVAFDIIHHNLQSSAKSNWCAESPRRLCSDMLTGR